MTKYLFRCLAQLDPNVRKLEDIFGVHLNTFQNIKAKSSSGSCAAMAISRLVFLHDALLHMGAEVDLNILFRWSKWQEGHPPAVSHRGATMRVDMDAEIEAAKPGRKRGWR